MMTSEQRELISILRSILNPSFSQSLISVSDWNNLIEFAKNQGLIAYLYLYVNILRSAEKPSDNIIKELTLCYRKEIRRSAIQMITIDQTREQFENNGTCNLFLRAQ